MSSNDISAQSGDPEREPDGQFRHESVTRYRFPEFALRGRATAIVNSTEAQALPLRTFDGRPDESAGMQVSSTGRGRPEMPEANGARPVLGLNPGAGMPAGTAMARARQGTALAWTGRTGEQGMERREAGRPPHTCTPDAAFRRELTASGSLLVRNAIAPGPCMVVANHPALQR
ncbi:hypothetical protein [Streptomyces sp. NPDC001665]